MRLDLRLSDESPEDPDERADLQLTVDRGSFTPGAGFTAHHLLDDPYVVVLPETHALAGEAEVELSLLGAEQWVDNDFARGWCRRVLLEACACAGFSPPFHVEAHDYRSAIAFVAAGVGITVLPKLGAADLPAGVVALPLVRPTPVRSIYVVVRDAVGRTPPVALAVNLLREIAGRSASTEGPALCVLKPERPRPGGHADAPARPAYRTGRGIRRARCRSRRTSAAFEYRTRPPRPASARCRADRARVAAGR